MIILISIILENIFNIYLLPTQFTLISLIFLYFYFQNDKKRYLLTSFLIGLLYDIFYTNFYVLNPFLFFIISICLYYILHNHKTDILTIIISGLFIIFLYNLLLFLIFNFFNYSSYTIIDFSFILRHLVIVNMIYLLIIYFVFKRKLSNNF